MSFQTVTQFENQIAAFYSAPYAIATDCCTHAIELCLRYTGAPAIESPKRTYVSVPMLANKLGLYLHFRDFDWEDYYYLTHNIVDAAVYWKKGGYLPSTFMCLSFQKQKHLSLGRGGMILTDDPMAAKFLRKMAYDGRERDTPWREQDISIMGYHYYMTPEIAQEGLNKYDYAINSEPRKWVVTDWPDVSQMRIFNE